MNQKDLDQLLSLRKIVPVVNLDAPSHARPLGKALIESGLPIAEITLRSECALEAIEKIAELEKIELGAGTVLNLQQAKDAISAGARFIVSPGLDIPTIEYCLENSIPIYPGVSSATEVQRAFNLGLRTVKFFPAEACGGVKMLKALSAPFHSMKFMPTGGINLGNLKEYLSLESVIAVGGSWMVKPALFADGNFDAVIACANEAVAHCRTTPN